jgi:transposase InsO family protein
MSHAASPSTTRRYGVVMVAEEFGGRRSTYYAARARTRATTTPDKGKRGPRTTYTDAELVEKIREVLAQSPFTGEGYRKAWARLRVGGVRTSKARVLRLMRAHGLLAPVRPTRHLGPRTHEGTIITEQPDQMWGTDLTTTVTLEEGLATVFVAVDHCTTACVGIHAAKAATRFGALAPIRQGVRQHFGGFEAAIASGLMLRHDNGSQYLSDVFQNELRFLGIESSPSFVRAPEGNGCAERFIRTLKEQLLWVRTFRTIEELRQALLSFAQRYNHEWLVERHGHRTPTQVRREALAEAA